jgi:hypothetical protein
VTMIRNLLPPITMAQLKTNENQPMANWYLKEPKPPKKPTPERVKWYLWRWRVSQASSSHHHICAQLVNAHGIGLSNASVNYYPPVAKAWRYGLPSVLMSTFPGPPPIETCAQLLGQPRGSPPHPHWRY